MTHRQFAMAFAVVAVGVVAVGLARYEQHFSFLIGDCPYYALTAESVLKDGDFDLGNQLAPGTSGAEFNEKLRSHEGFFAVGANGRPVPKHSVIMPILALPFRIAFGWYGFLVFNVLQMAALIYGISVLAGNTPTTRLLALVAYLASPFVGYTYNFSLDIFGTTLIVWCYIAATRGYWIAVGLTAGLAIWAKVYLGVFLLPAGLLVASGGWRAIARSIAASLVILVPMFIFNTLVFGGPLVTGYDRDGVIRSDGTLGTLDHYQYFNQPFFLGLSRLLFDPDLGAVWTSPVWVLWPVGVGMLWRAGQQRLAAAIAVVVVANFVLFATFEGWNNSVGGNRYLFPAFAMGYAAQGPLWERMRARLDRTHPTEESKANSG